MKKTLSTVLAVFLFVVGIPVVCSAALISDIGGWIYESTPGVSIDITIDASLTGNDYFATITDTSDRETTMGGGPLFGLENLYLQIIIGDGDDQESYSTLIEEMNGSSTINFSATPGETIHALIYGTVADDAQFNAGSYTFEVGTVPVPATIFMLGFGLVALTVLRKKKLQ